MARAMATAYGLGHTPKSLEEAQRDTLWWVYARVQAAMNLRPQLLSGWGIAWTSAGYAELVPVEVPRPGPGRVTILVHSSAVSPGTERAQYLRLPNAQVGVLGRPGYSAAGVVHSVGPRVQGLAPGDRVAVTGAAHASVVTAHERNVFRVPDGVSLEDASLVMLGMICGNGVRLARLAPGEAVCSIGAGPIGALAGRLAQLDGHELTFVATSHRRESFARRTGARFLSLAEDADEIEAIRAPVVIEATGSPDAIGAAVAAAGRRARIVLLGSPRGITRDLPVERIREKELEIVGAHVDTLDLEPDAERAQPRRREAEAYLRALADRGLDVQDLVGPAIDPRRASVFYRELAEGSDVIGAHFDWTRLTDGERVGRGHVASIPNIAGRGMEEKFPLAPRRRRRGIFEPADPFAGARGHLRIGLLGCGDIGVQNASAVAAAPNTELVACFDPSARLAEDLAARHGARAMPTAEALAESPDVDAVLVCVPHHLHEPLAEQAIAAGKHTVVEKPLAHTLASAVKMMESAERAGVVLSTCFPQRYDPRVVVAKTIIEAGGMGELSGTLIRLFLDKSPAYWSGGFSGRSHSDWRRSREKAGGGVLIMNLSHHIDLVRHLSGVEADLVTAQGGAVEQPGDIEDAVTASIGYSNGAIGSLHGGASVRGSTEQDISLWGSEGRVVIEPHGRVYTLRPLPGLRTARWHSFGRLPSVSIRAVYFSRLATALEEGRPPDVTAADGVAVQAIIEAVYTAMEAPEGVRPADLVARHAHGAAVGAGA